MFGRFFKKKNKPIGVCIGGYEFGKPHTRLTAPGQGMTIKPDELYRELAGYYIEAATKTAQAEGKTIVELAAEGQDVFIAAAEAGGAMKVGNELMNGGIFAEAVRTLSVPGFRVMYDPKGDFYARAVPEAEARCGWHLPNCK